MESYQEFWIWTIESGWSWSGCSTTSADSWIDICGDGEGAAVKDDAAKVDQTKKLKTWRSINLICHINFNKLLLLKFYFYFKMDLIDQTNRCVKVRIEELESKIRDKKDLYYILGQCCKFIF